MTVEATARLVDITSLTNTNSEGFVDLGHYTMYRIVSAATLVAGALVAGSAWAAAGSNADQAEESVAYQINPAHSGSVTFAAGFTAPLAKLWSYDTKGAVTYPLVAGGQVFVVSS